MKLPRMVTSLGARVIVSTALAATPYARANDFAMPFGAQMSAPVSGLFVATTAAHWATTISAHALVTALAMHEDHHDLGGNIACHPSSAASLDVLPSGHALRVVTGCPSALAESTSVEGSAEGGVPMRYDRLR